ncbi:MAG: hypothetical protein P8I48_00715, partial [Candidatus Marinimicrobia bacterium]|nr:hypothetical protein [Candidatus Neomarinimicrobiota bacterium]
NIYTKRNILKISPSYSPSIIGRSFPIIISGLLISISDSLYVPFCINIVSFILENLIAFLIVLKLQVLQTSIVCELIKQLHKSIRNNNLDFDIITSLSTINLILN